MKKSIYFALLMFFINVYAQNIYPLETYYEDAPEYSYMKDLDNELDPYVGIYTATDNGKTIELNITKHLKFKEDLNKIFYKDILKIRVRIKNNLGQVIYENLLIQKIYFKVLHYQWKEMLLFFIMVEQTVK